METTATTVELTIPIPTANNIVVRKDEAPEDYQGNFLLATVVAMGPCCDLPVGKHERDGRISKLQVGDHVACDANDILRVVVKGDDYYLMNEKQVKAVFKKND